MGPWQDMGWWGMGGMWIFWIVMIVVIVLLIRLIMPSTTSGTRSGESPEDILKKRYARGEIDHKTYQKMLEDLRR